MIVAIDGPAASGKSTVARALASRLGMHYLDTGAMYRSVALAALNSEISIEDEASIENLAQRVVIEFAYEDGASIPTRVLLDGTDVSSEIRTPAIDEAVSAVARMPVVREAMVNRQREIAAQADTVMEGRDIGTVVFPGADVKVFLTASSEERARRRQAELADRGHDSQADRVREGMERRDHADSSRKTAPLRAAEDAVRVDTTGLTAEQVVDLIEELVEAAR